MKKVILAIVLFVTTLSQAQESFYNNIKDGGTYVYSSFKKSMGGYTQNRSGDTYTAKKHFLPSGECYRVELIHGVANSTMDWDASEANVCNGFPYEAVYWLDGRYGIISMGDFIFCLEDLKKDLSSFTSVGGGYVLQGGKSKKSKKAKKKGSFFSKLKAIKGKLGGDALKIMGEKKLDKRIQEYLNTMKAKQVARTAKEKQIDQNILALGKRDEAARKKESDRLWAVAKKHNDSFANTEEGKKYWAYINARQAAGAINVEVFNETGERIEIFKQGSSNRITSLASGFTEDLDCRSTYTYTKFGQSVPVIFYNANSACDGKVTVR